MPKNLDDLKGDVKKTAGDATDDKDLKREGQADKASGTVKDGVDKAKDKLPGN